MPTQRSQPLSSDTPKTRKRTKKKESAAIELSISPLSFETRSDAQFVLTNNFNLLAMLGCGYIKPRSAFEKYYEDLLSISENAIPLLQAPVGIELQERTCVEQFSFPVLIELAPNATFDGISERTDAVKCVAGAIPVSAWSYVHFRNDEEASAFLMRDYEGIDYSLVNHGVSSQLFSREVLGDGHVIDALRGSKVKSPPQSEYLRADRIAGSLGALLAIRHGTEGDVRGVLSLCSLVLSPEERRNAMVAFGYPAVDLITLETRLEPTVDDLIFSISLGILRSQDRAVAWDPADVLGQIRQMCRARGVDETASVETMFNYMQKVLSLDADFRPFRADTGHSAGKALLLALLRPALRDFLEWSRSETGSDDVTDALAVLLIGSVTGFELLPPITRPHELVYSLATWQSLFLNAQASPSLVVALTHLLGQTAVERLCAATWPLSRAAASPEISDVELLARVIDSGWTDCVVTEIDAVPIGSLEISTGDKGMLRVRLRGLATLRQRVDHDALQQRGGEMPSRVSKNR